MDVFKIQSGRRPVVVADDGFPIRDRDALTLELRRPARLIPAVCQARREIRRAGADIRG
jgi:hypothetical protein